MHELITEKRGDAIFVVILSVFVASLFVAISSKNLPGWDESVYIGMGKYLFSLGKIGSWEIMRPLALPVILGLLWKLGVNIILAAKVAAIVFSAISLVLVYLIGKRLFGHLAGLAAAFFLAITPVFFIHSAFALTDIPSAMFALLAVYLLIRGANPFFVGLAASLAFLFRFPQGIFFIGVLVFIFLKNFNDKRLLFRRVGLYAGGFLVPTVPFLVFNYFMYIQYVSVAVAAFRPVLFAVKQQANPFYGGSLFYYPFNLFRANPLLIFSLVGIVCLWGKCKGYRLLVLIVLGLFLAYFSYIPSKVIRFSLVFLPYMALFAGWGFAKVMGYGRLRVIVLALLLVVGASILVYLTFNSRSSFLEDDSIEDFYSYFAKNPINGTVIITVPQPVAYSDIKAEPVYYSPAESLAEMGNVSAVMFVPSVFSCPESDVDCEQRMASFFEDVRSQSLVFSKEYWGDDFEIYLVS